MHAGQRRKSGEPYITHPLAVAEILAKLGMDTTTLIAALLHDTVEDTSYTLEALEADFNAEVAHLVDGVTKLDKAYLGQAAEPETIRKMIVAAGRDVRVLIIKLADRLHNMQTLGFKSRPSQIRIAQATRDVLIPLADRLGIHVLKRELEDLVLKALRPPEYARIEEYARTRSQRTNLASILEPVREALRENRIQAVVADRPRHLWSIYREMLERNLREPHDPPRLLITITGPYTDCYAALGAIHSLWRPVPGRFKDYIASPKFNLYQSLHTTVIGPGDQPLEALIRTDKMHRIAEYGIIAHLQDRSRGGRDSATASSEELEWLNRLLAWQREALDPSDFLASLRCDLSEEQILVFTMGGDQVLLPAEATPIDLAYSLDPNIGNRLIGAYVNGRLAPLTAMLEDGDVVEIITARDPDCPGPSEDWLEVVRTPQARLQIRQWFDSRGAGSEALTKKIKAGRLAIALALRQHDRVLFDDAPLRSLAVTMGHGTVESLLVAVTEGRIAAQEVAERLIAIVDKV